MWVTANGDCVEVIKTLDDNSIDSVVTDPPYALSFMGKDWDSFGDGKGYQKWCEEWARECLRVLKPGGYLLAFGGTRTYHRLACAIEDAGFEIRDSLHWIYGSGFPKSLNVSKAIDKAAGAEREVIGDKLDRPGYHLHAGPKAGEALGSGINGHTEDERLRSAQITAPATQEAQTWEGWGTALKPAHEPIVMARKPLQRRPLLPMFLSTILALSTLMLAVLAPTMIFLVAHMVGNLVVEAAIQMGHCARQLAAEIKVGGHRM